MFKYYLYQTDLQFITSSLEDELRRMQGSHVFITGATGIIGKWILASLLYADDVLSWWRRATKTYIKIIPGIKI